MSEIQKSHWDRDTAQRLFDAYKKGESDAVVDSLFQLALADDISVVTKITLPENQFYLGPRIENLGGGTFVAFNFEGEGYVAVTREFVNWFFAQLDNLNNFDPAVSELSGEAVFGNPFGAYECGK